MNFEELITKNTYANLELVHPDFDSESTTIVDLSIKSFTTHGLVKFDRILKAPVLEVKEIDGITYVWLDDLSLREMEKFASDYAGYCPNTYWETYFVENVGE